MFLVALLDSVHMSSIHPYVESVQHFFSVSLHTVTRHIISLLVLLLFVSNFSVYIEQAYFVYDSTIKLLPFPIASPLP